MTLTAQKVPLLVVFLLWSVCGICQLPDDFEFLDHRTRLSQPGATAMIGDKIYYVSHNEITPWTTVNVVDSENNVETILSLEILYSNSRLYQTSDTSAVIIVDELVEWDIGAPGFYKINLSPNQVKIDSLFTGWEEDNFFVSSAAIDSEGRAVLLSDHQLLLLDNDELINIGYSEEYLWRLRYIKDQLFAYDGHGIYKFTGIEFEIVDSVDNYILEIKTFGNENFVLFEVYNSGSFSRRLDVYNIDFTEKLRSLDLPEKTNSLDQFIYNEEGLHFLTSNADQLEIKSIDNNGSMSTVHIGDAKDEEYFKFIPIEEDRFLIGGQYGIDGFSNNIFYRNYSLSEENIYDRVDIKILELEVTSLGYDSEGYQEFDIQLKMENKGSNAVSYANIFSQNKLDGTNPKLHLDIDFTETIAAGDISELTIKTKVGHYRDVNIAQDLPWLIPGADLKFNKSSQYDVNVSVGELIEDTSFIVYPNPTREMLTISYDKPLKSILIYDLNGILQYSKFNLNSKNKIDISNLPAGNYILKANIKNQDQYLISKFIKI